MEGSKEKGTGFSEVGKSDPAHMEGTGTQAKMHGARHDGGDNFNRSRLDS